MAYKVTYGAVMVECGTVEEAGALAKYLNEEPRIVEPKKPVVNTPSNGKQQPQMANNSGFPGFWESLGQNEKMVLAGISAAKPGDVTGHSLAGSVGIQESKFGWVIRRIKQAAESNGIKVDQLFSTERRDTDDGIRVFYKSTAMLDTAFDTGEK